MGSGHHGRLGLPVPVAVEEVHKDAKDSVRDLDSVVMPVQAIALQFANVTSGLVLVWVTFIQLNNIELMTKLSM